MANSRSIYVNSRSTRHTPLADHFPKIAVQLQKIAVNTKVRLRTSSCFKLFLLSSIINYIMRKLLDTKAGATYYEEMPNLTLCTRKDCIEFIFKLKPGIYVIINMSRGTGGKIMLYANWDKYFMRMQNPDVQLQRIKKNCPTLFAVLTGEDKDDVSLLSHRNAPAHERGFGVFCDGDVDTPLIAHIDTIYWTKWRCWSIRTLISTTSSTPLHLSLPGKTDFATCGIENQSVI